MSEADVDAWREHSRCLTPPNSTAVRFPARRRGGRAGRSGQQTAGPRASTANPPVLHLSQRPHADTCGSVRPCCVSCALLVFAGQVLPAAGLGERGPEQGSRRAGARPALARQQAARNLAGTCAGECLRLADAQPALADGAVCPLQPRVSPGVARAAALRALTSTRQARWRTPVHGPISRSANASGIATRAAAEHGAHSTRPTTSGAPLARWADLSSPSGILARRHYPRAVRQPEVHHLSRRSAPARGARPGSGVRLPVPPRHRAGRREWSRQGLHR